MQRAPHARPPTPAHTAAHAHAPPTHPHPHRPQPVARSFLGVGAPEAVLVAIVALVVFGPKGLADAAKSLGQALRAFQPTIREVVEVSQDLRGTLEKVRGRRMCMSGRGRGGCGGVCVWRSARACAARWGRCRVLTAHVDWGGGAHAQQQVMGGGAALPPPRGARGACTRGGQQRSGEARPGPT